MTLGGEVMAGKSMETYGANRIKAGDRLIRERDHLGRPDDAVTVTRVGRKGYTIYYLAGYWRESETPSSLCAQGYRIVERAGERVATFFKRYW